MIVPVKYSNFSHLSPSDSKNLFNNLRKGILNISDINANSFLIKIMSFRYIVDDIQIISREKVWAIKDLFNSEKVKRIIEKDDGIIFEIEGELEFKNKGFKYIIGHKWIAAEDYINLVSVKEKSNFNGTSQELEELSNKLIQLYYDIFRKYIV